MTKAFFYSIALLYVFAGLLTIGSMIASLFIPLAEEHVVRTIFAFLLFGGATYLLSVALRIEPFYGLQVGLMAICGVGMAFVLDALPQINSIMKDNGQSMIGWIGFMILTYGLIMTWFDTDVMRSQKTAIIA